MFKNDFEWPPLSLFDIGTVPVPIPDKNRQADSYSQVRIQKSYIAAGIDYYIQIRMTEMLMCKSIGYIYYCEELFVVKHRSKHSCVSAIFYELGPQQVIKNCKFDYMYNATVPPVILDGGRDVLLANFHGPRSLKCTSINGGLAKPALEHTYAVVNREFLCDCQLDLEHASVLRQLSSCKKDESSKLVMQFHVNITFWELLRKQSPQIAEQVQPKFTDHRQTFDVRLFEGKQKRLDQPTDLEVFMERIDKNGKRIPTRNKTDNKKTPKPLLPRWLNNILVIVCTVFSTLLTQVVLLLLVKHFKMKSLIASLLIATLPPPSVASVPSTRQFDIPRIQIMEPTLEHYLSPNKMTFSPFLGYIYENCKNIVNAFPEGTDPTNQLYDEWTKAAKLVKPDKSESSKKVVCSYPITTMWRNVLGTMLICYAVIKYCQTNDLVSRLYVFFDHYYSPLKICPLRGHLQNYKIKDSGTDLELNLNKNWIYNTVNISWGDVQVLENQIPIKLPKSVTMPLRHKIKNRRMVSFDWDVQYLVKQGHNWYNLTRTYKAKRKAVSFASLDEIDEVETSSLCGKLTVKRKPIVKEVAV